MQITNSLTKQKEELTPRQDKQVQMFVCGPTVYDYIHIGNARTFVFFDVVAKYLRFKGYEVDYIQNITDIDDKIIQRAAENNRNPLDWAKEYEKYFLQDMANLGVTGISKYARATDHIDQVVKQVKTLIDKGHAYLIEGDGYYFDLSTFPEYGKLSGRTAVMADDAISRIDESIKKKNAGDFALWKFSKPGEPAWDTELGKGRPGWHIEDTAITEHYFGPQYDIHGGGQDLIFPHHEAEITQQESASGLKPFVKYWLHVAFLINKEQKMSKSLGNFETVHNLLSKYSPEALRFYLLSAHYRTPLDYSEKLLNQSAAAVRRIKEFINKLTLSQGENIYEKPIRESLDKTRKDFEKAMDDDFNTPNAIAEIFGLIRGVNSLQGINSLPIKVAEEIIRFFKEIDSIFGIIPKKEEKIPEEIAKLVEQREKHRKEKNFAEADKIRVQVESLGYKIEDTVYGPLIIRL